ncbi:hypothetical protein [Actinophytocola sediminis]
MRPIRPFALFAVLCTLAAMVVTAAPAAATVLPNGFRSVGYLPSWSGSVNAVQYGKLTHINYAFALPNANGTLQAIPIRASSRRW